MDDRRLYEAPELTIFPMNETDILISSLWEGDDNEGELIKGRY